LESGMRGDAEREGAFGEKWDKCHPLIGWPNFNIILSLNSIISLQINFLIFFLYQNSWFFFSISRDLVHLIWT
jgi:hypothetical protein